MAINKELRDTMSVVAVFVAAGAVIFANLLSDKRFVRWDLTAEQRFTISEPFMNILGKLKDPITVTYYVSDQVPLSFEQGKRDILDKLREIETAGKGRITLKVVDPSPDKALTKKLEEKGLMTSGADRGQDRMTMMKFFSAVEILYSSKVEPQYIPLVQAAEDLEYDLALKILFLTREKRPLISIMLPRPDYAGSALTGGASPTGFEWMLGEDNQQEYDLRSIRIDEVSGGVPKDTNLLVLIRPKDLSDRARYEIQKYLAQGGHVVLLAGTSRFIQDNAGRRVEQYKTGLEDYCRDFGVNWSHEILCDFYSVQVPIFAQIQPENVKRDSPLTQDIYSIYAMNPTALLLDTDKLKASGLENEVLITTSSKSWSEPYSEVFDPTTISVARNKYEGEKPIMLHLKGQFPWKSGVVPPPWPKRKGMEDVKDPDPTLPETIAQLPGHLVIFTAPDSFQGEFLKSDLFKSNRSLMSHMIEYFAYGTDLVKIRTKRVEVRTIEKLGNPEQHFKRDAIKLALIGSVGLLVAVAGAIWFFLRHQSQVRYERQYSETTGPSAFDA